MMMFTQGTGINRGGLYIRDVKFHHAGEYRCVVKSTSNELTLIATLTVIGKYFDHVYLFYLIKL